MIYDIIYMDLCDDGEMEWHVYSLHFNNEDNRDKAADYLEQMIDVSIDDTDSDPENNAYLLNCSIALGDNEGDKHFESLPSIFRENKLKKIKDIFKKK